MGWVIGMATASVPSRDGGIGNVNGGCSASTNSEK